MILYDKCMTNSMNELMIDAMIDDLARDIDLRADHDPTCITDLHAMMRALINDDYSIINSIEPIELDASLECAIETISFNMISRCFVITNPDDMIIAITDLHDRIK